MNVSVSARRAGSAGHSGGSGQRRSIQRRMLGESASTSPSSSTTGTRSCPLTARIEERSAGSWSTYSNGTAFRPSAISTRSTLVEKGMR